MSPLDVFGTILPFISYFARGLLKDIDRNGHKGIGKPEPLKNIKGYWSREIDEKIALFTKLKTGKLKLFNLSGSDSPQLAAVVWPELAPGFIPLIAVHIIEINNQRRLLY